MIDVPKRAERLLHVVIVLIAAAVLCQGQDAVTLLLFVILALDLIAYLTPDGDIKKEKEEGIVIK